MARQSPRSPSSPPPRASVIAGRFVQVTGDLSMLTTSYPTGSNFRYGYSLGGLGGDRLYTHLRWEQPDGAGIVLAQIGDYDPAKNEWRCAPEYVRRGERPSLVEHVKNRLVPEMRADTAKARAAGKLAVDVFHQNTQRVRRDIDRHIQRLPLSEIVERPGAQVRLGLGQLIVAGSIKADTHTHCYPTLVAGIDVGRQDGPIPDSILALNFKGLQMTDARVPGHIIRSPATMPVARRSPQNPQEWIPLHAGLTPDEFDTVASTAAILDRAAVSVPDFSSFHAAVAYNTRPEHQFNGQIQIAE